MTDHYHDPSDREYMKVLRKNSPSAFRDMVALTENAIHGDDLSIPTKYAELMAVSVALTTQCVYCLEGHVKGAKAAGASEKELSDTVMIATALRAGGGFAHGMMALKFFDTGDVPSASDESTD